MSQSGKDKELKSNTKSEEKETTQSEPKPDDDVKSSSTTTSRIIKPEEFARDVLNIIKPTKTDDEARGMALKHLIQNIKKIDTLEDFRVTPYGSFESGLHSKHSDIDISIHAKGSPKELLPQVTKALSRDDKCTDLITIWGKVPVLKLKVTVYVKEKKYDISCDVTVNNDTAEFNTPLLKELRRSGPQVPDLVLLVKRWSVAANLCETYKGTFSSFSIYVLTIFFLQNCVPPFLPPLSEFSKLKTTERNAEPCGEEAGQLFIQITDSDTEKAIRNAIVEYVERKAKPSGKEAGQLFFEFIDMFQDIKRKSEVSFMSAFEGKWVDYQREQKAEKILMIEDPFEVMREGGRFRSPFARIPDRIPQNILVGTNKHTLERISDAFIRTQKEILGEVKLKILRKMKNPNFNKFVRNKKERGGKLSGVVTAATRRFLKFEGQ